MVAEAMSRFPYDACRLTRRYGVTFTIPTSVLRKMPSSGWCTVYTLLSRFEKEPQDLGMPLKGATNGHYSSSKRGGFSILDDDEGLFLHNGFWWQFYCTYYSIPRSHSVWAVRRSRKFLLRCCSQNSATPVLPIV